MSAADVKKGQQAAPSNGLSGPPEGFQRSGSANAVGWFNQGKIGNVLSGKLSGMFERKDALRKDSGGTSNFFQVQIDRECEVRAERGDEAKMVTAKPGDYVNVNYGPKTKVWEEFITDIKHGAEYAVFGTIAGSKIKITAGRQMHNFEVFHKMVRPPMEQEDDLGEALREPSGNAAV